MRALGVRTSEADTSYACRFVVPGLENGKIPRSLIGFCPFDTDVLVHSLSNLA